MRTTKIIIILFALTIYQNSYSQYEQSNTNSKAISKSETYLTKLKSSESDNNSAQKSKSENKYCISTGFTFGDAYFSSPNSSSFTDHTPRIGMKFGTEHMFNLNKMADINFGVGIVQSRSKIEYPGFDLNWNFLNLDLYSAFRFKPIPMIAITGGLFADIGLSAKVKYSDEDKTYNMYGNQPNEEIPPLKRVSTGIYFRAGLIPKFNKGEIYISHRNGLNNILNNDANPEDSYRTGLTAIGVIVYLN